MECLAFSDAHCVRDGASCGWPACRRWSGLHLHPLPASDVRVRALPRHPFRNRRRRQRSHGYRLRFLGGGIRPSGTGSSVPRRSDRVASWTTALANLGRHPHRRATTPADRQWASTLQEPFAGAERVHALLERLRMRHRDEERAHVGARGRGIDSVSRGRLGPKGLQAWEANNSPDRLTRPLVRRNGGPGTGELGRGDEPARLPHARYPGPLHRVAIGFYTSGQLLLEEYYILAL